MPAHHGRCHCGAVEVLFESPTPPGDVEVRACGCGFCRRHGARTVSDPAGRLEFRVNGEVRLYRFGLGITDYLVCARCGCYVGARMEEADGAWGIVNILMLDDGARFSAAAAPRDYDAEDAAARRARRRRMWTPVAVSALA